jgi:hypothetical protein
MCIRAETIFAFATCHRALRVPPSKGLMGGCWRHLYPMMVMATPLCLVCLQGRRGPAGGRCRDVTCRNITIFSLGITANRERHRRTSEYLATGQVWLRQMSVLEDFERMRQLRKACVGLRTRRGRSVAANQCANAPRSDRQSLQSRGRRGSAGRARSLACKGT